MNEEESSSWLCIEDINTLQNLCRICLTPNKDMHRLDSEIVASPEENISTICDVLRKVVSRQINSKEHYPSYICGSCLERLNVSYNFRLQFEKSDALLKECLGDYDTEEDKKMKASVELIASAGVFDLKDVIVVDDPKESVSNYSGFLKNLGSEISATFVNLDVKNVCETSYNANITTKTEIQSDGVPEKQKLIRRQNEITNNKLLKCTVCDKTFANKINLNRHTNRVHYYKKETFVCEICGTSLNSRSSYLYHMKTHGNKKHKCSYCHKTYPTANNLQQHIMSRHTNERPHLCSVCGKTFSYQNALLYHMRIHTGERRYTCQFCGKLFRMQCGLSRHLRIHTGLRPYGCRFCDKAFRSKGEVNCHEMIHTGYRPYHCKYCNKGFTKTYNLRMHLLKYPGNHLCMICNKTFIEVEYLRLHMKIAHRYLEDEDSKDNNAETEMI